MPIFVVSDTHYGFISRISTCLTLILAITLICQHVFKLYERIFKKKISGCNPSFIFSIVLLLSVFLIHIPWFWIAYQRFNSGMECHVVVLFGSCCYIIVKWSLYMYFTFRLDTAFKGSLYAYSNRILYTFRAFLIISNAIEMVLLVKFAQTELDYEEHGAIGCRTTYPFILLISVVIIDISACSVNLYLFITKLHRVTEAIKRLNPLFATHMYKNQRFKDKYSSSRSIGTTPSSKAPSARSSRANTQSSLNHIHSSKNNYNTTETDGDDDTCNSNNQTDEENETSKSQSKSNNNINNNNNNADNYKNSDTLNVIDRTDSMHNNKNEQLDGDSNTKNNKNNKKKKNNTTQNSATKKISISVSMFGGNYSSKKYANRPGLSKNVASETADSLPQLSASPRSIVAPSEDLGAIDEIEIDMDDAFGETNNYKYNNNNNKNNNKNNNEKQNCNGTADQTRSSKFLGLNPFNYSKSISRSNDGSGNGSGNENSRPQTPTQSALQGFRNSLLFGKKSKSKERTEKEIKLLKVIRKHVILTGMGVCSTIAVMILIGLFGMPILWYVNLNEFDVFACFYRQRCDVTTLGSIWRSKIFQACNWLTFEGSNALAKQTTLL